MSEWGRPAPEGLTDTPAELAEAARLHLREKFLRAKVGVSGANFMVAETGTLVVVESEGNGRMCLTLPETLISVVGIEKIVPTWQDLEVFLQTLPRSSTAERMNPYTSTWTGTTDEDGPRTFHLVLIDNGRTDTLADEVGRQALRCIRCSACLNVCPVYERAGGHAYGSVYPGPIGAILSPQLRGTQSEIDASLPYASSLCGACYDVCPVAIDIPEVLVHLRERIVEGGLVTRDGAKVVLKPAKGHAAERAAMRAARWAFGHPGALRTGQRFASRTRRFHPRTLPGPGKAWSETRACRRFPRSRSATGGSGRTAGTRTAGARSEQQRPDPGPGAARAGGRATGRHAVRPGLRARVSARARGPECRGDGGSAGGEPGGLPGAGASL
jgi:L-lactate dehydrogenase complex protein LldF